MRIKSLNDLSANCIHTYSESGYVDVSYHPVYSLTNGGNLNFLHPQIGLYCFKNVSLISPSEIIRFDDGYIVQRYHYPSHNFEFITDPCLIYPSPNPQVITIAYRKSDKHLRKAFSLLNHSINHWAHFLAEVLPKLVAFDQYPVDIDIPILVPRITDQHILELIYRANTKQRPILFLDDGDSMFCDELYWISNCSYICNHSSSWHPSVIVIPRWTRKIMYDFLSTVLSQHNVEDFSFRRIFLARTNNRTLVNMQAISEYFEKRKFTIVSSPHTLSLSEKISIFRSASYVVGPASSAMMNCIFNANPMHVLGFYNYSRAMDSFLTQIWATEEPRSSFNIIIGNSSEFSNLQSSYTVDLSIIESFMKESSVWSKV